MGSWGRTIAVAAARRSNGVTGGAVFVGATTASG